MKKPTPPKSRIIYEKVVTFYDQYILFALSLILAGSTVFFGFISYFSNKKHPIIAVGCWLQSHHLMLD